MPVSDEDCLYFIGRAEAELELAQRAEHPKAVEVHYGLAESYLDRVYGGGSEEGAIPPPSGSPKAARRQSLTA